MNELPVTQQVLLDACTVAENIEGLLGDYLYPAKPGVYMPHRLEPSLVPGGFYYQKVCGQGMKPLDNLEDLQGEVVSIDAMVIVPRGLAKQLSWEPKLPVRGLALVTAAVDWAIADSSAWVKRRTGLLQVLRELLPEEHRDNEAVLCRLSMLLYDICTDVRAFIGSDRWIMHFFKQHGRDIRVEKTIDYRIHMWNMEHGHEFVGRS